jgi:hypothetical protein
MKRIIIPLVLVFIPMMLLSCKPEKPVPEDNPEIQAFLENYYQTFSDRDWERFELLFTDQAVLTTTWESESDSVPVLFTNTITQFLEQTGSGPDSQPIFEERMISSEVSVRNGLASAWVEYEARFGTEDNLMEWKGYDLFSLIQHEDRWYITSLSYIAQ